MAQKNKIFKSLESILPEATEEQLDAIVKLIDISKKSFSSRFKGYEFATRG